MALRPGSHRLGPEQGTVEVRTYREGVAQMAGHDLIIDISQWHSGAEVSGEGALSSLELEVDPRSLQVREGLRGVKPLTDKDRTKIREEIEGKVLGTERISFRSTDVQSSGVRLQVQGELALAGSTRPVSYELGISADGRVHGTLAIAQTEFGIKPYRGFMGALKVRDVVEVAIDVKLPSAD
ncbi:MAG: YceI family protein [Solirubrobacteraceae bacterium]